MKSQTEQENTENKLGQVKLLDCNQIQGHVAGLN